MIDISNIYIALLIFLGSAAAVIFFGVRLAVYGDALATLTGWGRLFVGSILVALATSLPELATNITVVTLEVPNPGLAFGNVVGANMLNMFTLAAVALVFGGKLFLERVAPEQGYLIVVAVVLTSLALLFGAVRMDLAAFKIGLASVILLVVFVVGMWVVYKTRPAGGDDEEEDPGMGLGKAWLMFLLVSAGVIVSGYFLGVSTDSIAEITGISSGTIGILLVSLVTTMPEASSTIAAARIGAMDLGVAGLYGSCAFNVTILFYADLFYRDGILVNQPEPVHFIAGTVAIGLMLTGLTLILTRNRVRRAVAAAGLSAMAAIYIAAAVVVAILGVPESENGEARAPAPPTTSEEI
jgi:cation:H+ antiporter